MYPELKLFIAGAWRTTRRDMAVVNPATEEELGRLPCADTSDLDDALAAAEEGFRIWSATSPRTRGDTILRAAALMRERQEVITPSSTRPWGAELRLNSGFGRQQQMCAMCDLMC